LANLCHNESKKENTISDLANELERISEQKRINPGSLLKNKQKRKELILMRNSNKNRLKGKLRRKKQQVREELGKTNTNIKVTMLFQSNPQRLLTIKGKLK